MNVDEIATSALELDDLQKRDAFLRAACGENRQLRHEVDALLHALLATDNDHFLSSGFFGSDKASHEKGTASNRSDSGTTQSHRFELRSRHAIGGLGEVWLAWDHELGREVALKQMRPEWLEHPEAVARFRREAEITGHLEHPGVVPIYALGDQSDGSPFYAMQFIRGRTLSEVVEEQLDVSEDGQAGKEWYEATQLRNLLNHFVGVCQTIDYSHSKQVVHRDLKPANIMLGAYGQTLVVDWGLAKRLDANSPRQEQGLGDSQTDDAVDEAIDEQLSLISRDDSGIEETHQGTTMGTPSYMSPEQALGHIDQIGPATDIYCLGTTLYFVLTGQPPHGGEGSLLATLEHIRDGEFAPPRARCNRVPKSLQAIVLKAMATAPQDRYLSAGALADEIQRYLGDESVSVFRDPPVERVLRWARKNRALTSATAVGLLLTFVASIAGLLIRQEMDRRETESARENRENALAIEFQETTRRRESVAAADAALLRADSAVREGRFADAAALMDVAVDRMANQPSLDGRRNTLLTRRDRMFRLGQFESLHQEGEDLDYLTRDTEAAVLLQASLDQLGVWESDTWWENLPDQELSAVQKDRLRWQVYRILTVLNTLYVTKMVNAMGGESAGGAPSALQLLRSYLSTKRGMREAQAAVELTERIQTFRPGQASRWLGGIAKFRISGGKRVEPRELGPPENPPDGQALAIFSLIASVDAAYRTWFRDYGESFVPKPDDVPPDLHAAHVALETLRRVSDQAVDDYWIRINLGQTYYLIAQYAQARGDTAQAIEHYELARSEYGRCIAIRPDAAFGYADRSTVALSQAVLLRGLPQATQWHRRRSRELLQTSLQDASQARRIEPSAHWVYWHVGATAAELGQTDTAIEAFFSAVDLGFDVQESLDAPIVRLDDLRGRSKAIEFAYSQADSVEQIGGVDPLAGRWATLIAALEFSRGDVETAGAWSNRACELAPNYWRANQIAGWCALRSELWADAEIQFDAALTLNPDDAISLIGAARVAEHGKQANLQRSNQLYLRAVDAAVSQRHQSTAWFGVAKHALRRGELDPAMSSLGSARKLDPACDLTQFIDLAKNEARRLILASRKVESDDQKEALLDRVRALKQFTDRIAALPIASVNQIVESSSDRPPRSLPLLGGNFELPWERYWNLSSQQQISPTADGGSSAPIAIVDDDRPDSTACLSIGPDASNARWRLEQVIPATSGQTYRLSASSRSDATDDCKAFVSLVSGKQELCRLNIPASESWTTCETVFTIEKGDSTEILPLAVRIEIQAGPMTRRQIDDLKIITEQPDAPSVQTPR